MSAPGGPSPHFLCKSIIPGQLFFIFCKSIILSGLADDCLGERYSLNKQILRELRRS